MLTLRAAFFASISLVGTNALAQPAPPPLAAPPPAAAPGPEPAPAPVPPPAAAAAPEASPAPPPPPTEVPPATPAEPLPPVAASPEAEPAAEPEKPANPEKLSVGKNGGFWQPGGLLQFWAFYDHSDATKRSTARLRRAEIRVKGEIAPKIVAYQVMIDAAKTLNFGSGDTLTPPSDTSILQDYFITFLSDYADVSLGQFKTQISLEGYTGSSKTILPERSLVSRAFGDRRDVGIRVEKKIGDYFSYSAGIYNGAGLNRVDNNNEKDVALRLEVYPIEGLTIAAAGAKTLGERDDELARDRVEGDVRYDANNFRAELEYIKAWDGVDDEEAGTTRISGHGAYAAVGYTFIDRIQPVVRVGFVDGNVDDDDNETLKQYAVGLNYLLRGNEMKLSLVGEYFSPEPPGAVGSEDMLELMLAAQVSF